MATTSRRKISRLINQSVMKQPLNKAFLTDVMSAIETRDQKYRRKPSQWYKPSSFVCLRQMYFMRTGEVPDVTRTEYNAVGMADTGTRRHVAIQEVLQEMESLGYDWKYLDVSEYLNRKWSEGKCLDIEIVGKVGAETKLFHKTLSISFMCDGILERLSTGQCYLFEFKNQVSFKFNGKERVDAEHIDQVSTYCMALDLDECFVLYENRDTCNLECPELLQITPEMKQRQVDKILECESYVERMVPPPVNETTKPCRRCQYQTACKKAGK